MTERRPGSFEAVDPFAYRNPGLHARIGIGRADATPPPDAPISNWGAATAERASGIASPLTATVLLLGDLKSPERADVALVLLDLGWWRTAEAESAVRAAVADQLRLPPARVLVSLSHTHAGPAIDPTSVAGTAAAAVAAYLVSLSRVVRAAAARARATAAPALLEWGRGSCHLAWSRDQWVPEEARYVCGFAPDQPADTTLLVGRVVSMPIVDEPGAEPVTRAVLVNYACHPTTLGPANTFVSADFVGEASELVTAETGAPMMFIQGASGELAPRRQYQNGAPGRTATWANGRQLGHAVLSTLAGMLPPGEQLRPAPTVESGAPLGIFALGPADPVDQRVDLACVDVAVPRNRLVEQWAEQPGISPAAATERARRAKLIGRLAVGDELRVPVTVCRLGDAALVATPGEAYSQLQRDLRARFADRPVLVANLTGGAHHGYLPPTEAYAQNLYQVWQTPAGPGALELVRDAGAALIEQLWNRESA